MKVKLLKKLRARAKEAIYMVPFDNSGNRVIIYDGVSAALHDPCYIGKISNVSGWNHQVRFHNPEYIRTPFTIEEALEVMRPLRREHICSMVNTLRREKREQEMHQTSIILRKKLKSL